ncbi:VOC family protein [Chryseobacterium kwangjuense]|uniref:Prolyl endopeptidase n=1 Tax=Chryseobacterium kwangjuense TaxID=267125 RepID=A0A135W931_9FLAO|nr:VOC family protein [Chryseobacterium kwangjuense]KXH81377.1 prolyl endopeptidase [Chryseobacterium kwangjuense]
MKFRYARHTTDLERIKVFYTSVLNFEVLGTFENHAGYDGIFLGKKNENWHLEFTVSDKIPTQVFDEDDLLVFYPELKADLQNFVENLKKHAIPLLQPENPYWRENGIYFLDPDGFGIIISKQFAK